MPLSDSPRLYLNEHLSPRLTAQLRRHGFDVTSSQDSEMLSENDSQQLAFAVSEQRAIVTFNFGDFVSLHEQYMVEGREHWGIILSPEESFNVLLHRMLRLLNSVSGIDLRNQIRWLNEFR